MFAAVVLAPAFAAADGTAPVSQGLEWTASARDKFYTQDQGSRMLPLKWLQALKQPDGRPFLADALARYGYLPNATSPSNPDGLPVGFTSTATPDGSIVGMSCAACHTRQLTVAGKSYRIDGGPAFADFQTFLADLDTATGNVLADGTSFDAFADAVLGTQRSATATAVLRADVTVWVTRFHALIKGSLPDKRQWGPARLDAISMIFNRLTGLDLGRPPTYLLSDNIKPADAPARYPFLWNAPIQDYTQWTGFAQNGNDFFALSRNLGEVYGVFGLFHPQQTKGSVAIFNRNYIVENSADFDGLGKLESYVKRIGPPAWSWPTDAGLVAKGKLIFDRDEKDGGCVGCHGIAPGEIRPPALNTWRTPIKNVGTDQREWKLLGRTALSGSMEGAEIPHVVPPILDQDRAITILKAAVVGAIGEYQADKAVGDLSLLRRMSPVAPGMATSVDAPIAAADASQAAATATASIVTTQRATTPMSQMSAAFRLPGMRPLPLPLPMPLAPAEPVPFSYEARVLQGIWAAAPYLHNGSVPTLADLLKPADQRPADFKVGSAYDIGTVGLAVDQPDSHFTLHTTGCEDVGSGDSRCGHEYGTTLPSADKAALLEYLKTL